MILLAEIIVTAILTGLIWTIQLVHYPAFHYVENDRYVDFANFHTKGITIIVMPLMFLELGISIYRALNLDFINVVLLIFVILIWLSTFLFSVPAHNILAGGKDEKVIERLVITNWIRTMLWTLRLFVLSFLFLNIYSA